MEEILDIYDNNKVKTSKKYIRGRYVLDKTRY